MKNIKLIFTSLTILFGLVLSSIGQVYDYSDGWSYLTTNLYARNIGPSNKVIHLGDGGGDTSSNRVVLVSQIIFVHDPSVIDTNTGHSTVNIYDYNGRNRDLTYAGGSGFFTNRFTNSGAVVVTSQYPTNFATSNVLSSGITNWYTNFGTYTLYTTNATGTNTVSPSFSISTPYSASKQSFQFTNLNLIFTRGIMIGYSSNVTVQMRYKKIFDPSNPN